jgi:fibro-slime domain-containing protein
MFVDQDLVIDLGGIRPMTSQFVFMDRKDLTHGERYTVRFFFASRTTSAPEFRLRTNIELDQSDMYPAVGIMFD